MVDEGYVQGRIGVHGHKEGIRVPRERQCCASRGRGLQILRRCGRGEIQFGQEDLAWEFLGAGDDEGMGEIVCEESGERCVVRGREGGGTEAVT